MTKLLIELPNGIGKSSQVYKTIEEYRRAVLYKFWVRRQVKKWKKRRVQRAARKIMRRNAK